MAPSPFPRAPGGALQFVLLGSPCVCYKLKYSWQPRQAFPPSTTSLQLSIAFQSSSPSLCLVCLPSSYLSLLITIHQLKLAQDAYLCHPPRHPLTGLRLLGPFPPQLPNLHRLRRRQRGHLPLRRLHPRHLVRLQAARRLPRRRRLAGHALNPPADLVAVPRHPRRHRRVWLAANLPHCHAERPGKLLRASGCSALQLGRQEGRCWRCC